MDGVSLDGSTSQHMLSHLPVRFNVGGCQKFCPPSVSGCYMVSESAGAGVWPWARDGGRYAEANCASGDFADTDPSAAFSTSTSKWSPLAT